MKIQCPKCKSICESEAEVAVGRRILCPFCNTKFAFERHMELTAPEESCLTACPHCGNVIVADEKNIGTRQKCVTCGMDFEIGKYKAVEGDKVSAEKATEASAGKTQVAQVASRPPVEKMDIPGFPRAAQSEQAAATVVPEVAPPPPENPPENPKESKAQAAPESWSVYTASAIAAAKEAAQENVSRPRQRSRRINWRIDARALRRRIAVVRYHLAHHMLGLIFLGAAAYGVYFLKGKIDEMNKEAAEQRELDAAELAMKNEEIARKNAQLREMQSKEEADWQNRQRLQKIFKETEKRFAAECGITDDMVGLIRGKGSASCVFYPYKPSRSIYKVNVNGSGDFEVKAISGDGEFKVVDGKDFQKRLGKEPSVAVMADGKVFVYPKGRYSLPPQGRGFCIKNANIRMFYYGGLGVDFSGLASSKKYQVKLCPVGKEDSGDTIKLDDVAYNEHVPYERIAEEIAFRIGVRPNDPKVGEELDSYSIVVCEVNDGRNGGVVAGSGSDSSFNGPIVQVVTLPVTIPTIPKIPKNFGRRTYDYGSSDKHGNSADENDKKISGLMISLSTPKVQKRVISEAGDSYWGHSSSEVGFRSTYEGRITGSTRKGMSVFVELEAIFITSPIGGGIASEQVAETRTIGVYELGSLEDGKPTSHKFSFTSNEVRETHQKYSGPGNLGWRHIQHRLSNSGNHYCGVVLRLKSEGKILKVKTCPSNRKWEKAAANLYFSL